ncbi:MAG: heme-binding protein [Acidobacteriota bacterium]
MRRVVCQRLLFFIAPMLFLFTGSAWLQSTAIPIIKAPACAYDVRSGTLVLKGDNFQSGAVVSLSSAEGAINFGRVKIKSVKKIVINNVSAEDARRGFEAQVMVNGVASEVVHLTFDAVDESQLTESDVKKIIEQTAAQAEASNLKVTIAVADAEGNVLGVFEMAGAAANTTIGTGKCAGRAGECGLEGVVVPSCAAAISKAVTGTFLSSQGHAFSTRTASFIVQEHFPPGVNFQAGGPLFGVQFSQLEVCSDINPKAPLGLSADPGGIPLYKNGLKVGGLGIEGDGKYTLDPDPTDNDVPTEELIAVAGARGYEPPAAITGDKIIVNGIRFKYVNAGTPAAASQTSFNNLRGTTDTACSTLGLAPNVVRNAPASEFISETLNGAPAGRVNKRIFPNGAASFRSGSALTVSEVNMLLAQAAAQAFKTRAAIRQPEGSAAEVNIAVVDTDGTLLGLFSTVDAPMFGLDVCVQKARTAAFFSKTTAASELRSVGLGSYVDAASRDGIRLDGSVAFSDRGHGFLSRPFFPDGIDETEHGPFSVAIEEFSPFNVGLQLDLITPALVKFLTTGMTSPNNCTGIAALKNGIQIFPGSVPLYKNGRLVGAIGVSGDGVDQDDLISAMGSTGFESPTSIRCDTVFVRGTRLPFVKFPRNPNR